MNNSDQPLSTFEEKLTAYIDSRLSEADAQAFEREHPEVVQERAAASRIGEVLKRGSVAPLLRNVDFFNRQILREISSSTARTSEPEHASTFSLWRLILAGAFCLLLAFGVYQGFVAGEAKSRPYMAQVLSVKAGDAALTTRLISEDGLTVVMIDGLEPMSEEFILN